MSADAATLKLDNQKNGWKGVCVSHHSNGLEAFDPVRALGRRYLHIREWSSEGENTLLSAYFGSNGVRGDLRDRDVRTALKLAAGVLDYPLARGIPIDRIDTHSLRIGGANALSLARKWGDGEVKLSWSTFPIAWRNFQRECQRRWQNVLDMFVLKEECSLISLIRC